MPLIPEAAAKRSKRPRVVATAPTVAARAEEMALPRRPPTREIGVSGLKHNLGLLDEEIARELQGDRGIKAYKEMELDPVIGGGLVAILTQMGKVEWGVESASADPVDVANADFVRSLLDDLSQSWTDTVVEIATMVQFGWSAHEIVYKLRRGQQDTPGESSQHDDGLWGWRKLALRSQDTRYRWEFGPDAGVRALMQQDPNTYALYTIPIDALLLFRPRQHKGSPEGRSSFRSAYAPWYWKTNMLRFEGIGAERDLAGLPMARIPSEVINANGQVYRDYERTVTLLRRNRQSGLVIPSDPWPTAPGVRQYDVELLRAAGERQFDTDKLVQRYNREMALALLADWLLLGHEKVG